MAEFFDMGKHGAFIWSSYIAVTIVLIALAVTSWRRLKKTEDAITRLKSEPPADQGEYPEDEK